MKKTLGILGTGIVLCTVLAPTVMAADLGTMPGDSRVEITDFEIVNELPTSPGTISFEEVPDIDFGIHSVESINATPAPVLNGTYEGPLQVSDFRPLAASQTEALAVIDAYPGPVEDTTAIRAEWTAAALAEDWELSISASNLSGPMADIAQGLSIGGKDVLTASANFVMEFVPGTYDHTTKLDDLGVPTLSLKQNAGIGVGEYTGTVTYTAATVE